MTIDGARTRLWREAHRILCIRLDSLGDVIMTSPAMAAVKQSRPDRHVTLLTSSSGAQAGRLIPCIDQVWTYEAPWMKRQVSRDSSVEDHRLIARLRLDGFDAAILFTVYSQSPLPAAFMCWLADIPLRVAHCR